MLLDYNCLKIIFFITVNMRIGICIPCYAPHIKYLSTCLQSINNQTRKPDIVSISISSNIENSPINIDSFSFPVVIVSTHEKQYAGKNRNIAAKNIQEKVDIVSFFDADDWMHPKCIELIEYHFLHSKVDSLTHYYEKVLRSDSNIQLQHYSWPEITHILHLDNFKIGRDSVCGRVWYIGDSNNWELGHCGHYSVRMNIWLQHPYNEHMTMGEDSELIWNIVTSGAKHGYSPDKLSLYFQ